MDLEHLQAIRIEELRSVILAIKAEKGDHGNLLEIGAGSGWQARELAAGGYAVFAIDVPGSRYDAHRIWPVMLYDGHRLPFKDASFDIVFSSNVLEHVADIHSFEREIHRVLKDDGIAVHVLPTSTWRIWTSLCHAIGMAQGILRKSGRGNRPRSRVSQKKSIFDILRLALWPHRHGERGNSLTEIVLFSRPAWERHFLRSHWVVRKYQPMELFYTGHNILGSNLSLRSRKIISRFLGSATSFYVLVETEDQNNSALEPRD